MKVNDFSICWENPLVSELQRDLCCLLAVFVTYIQQLHSLSSIFITIIIFIICTIFIIIIIIINSVWHGVIPPTSLSHSLSPSIALSTCPLCGSFCSFKRLLQPSNGDIKSQSAIHNVWLQNVALFWEMTQWISSSSYMLISPQSVSPLFPAVIYLFF